MKKYEISFTINETTKIVMPLKNSIEDLIPINTGKILLYIGNDKIILSKTTTYHNIIYLANLLKKSLNQELFLHSSFTKDIGYSHNFYLYNSINNPTATISNDISEWIGYLYHLWSARNQLISFNSWIYNNRDGSIAFEVTPVYPYLFSEPEEEPDYIPFEEWIKTYKPYFITTLSREVAEQWLEQAEQIIKIVEYNQKKWDLRSKEDVDS